MIYKNEIYFWVNNILPYAYKLNDAIKLHMMPHIMDDYISRCLLGVICKVSGSNYFWMKTRGHITTQLLCTCVGPVGIYVPDNTGHWPIVGSLLVHCLRRWPNIDPTMVEYFSCLLGREYDGCWKTISLYFLATCASGLGNIINPLSC